MRELLCRTLGYLGTTVMALMALGTAVMGLTALAVFEPASATEVVQWLPADSPVYEELQRLHTEGLIDTTVSLDIRPLARIDIAKLIAKARRENPDRIGDPGLVRLYREFSRELVDLGLAPSEKYTPPLADWPGPQPGETRQERFDDGRLWVIPYLDVAYQRNFNDIGEFQNGSRLGLRIGAQLGPVLFFQDYFAGLIRGSEQYTDALIKGEDIILITEDIYVSFRSRSIDLSFGRNRYSFGPAHGSNLLWSSPAAPVTNLRWDAKFFGGKLRGSAIHADVDAAENARLAGHRLDWTPIPSLSLGIHEAARYSSDHWEPLYVAGILPYTVVQRILTQDTFGDTSGASQRNNVIAGFSARWRIANGTTLYGEFLIDDINLEEGGAPTRLGYQFGWLGVSHLFGKRLSWRGEFDRVYRFVYTVFYGEDFIHQEMPLGYPQGPDVRTVLVNFQYDLSTDWFVNLGGVQNEKGEGDLDESYDPSGPPQSGRDFKGIVEKSWLVPVGLTWTPRDGVAFRAETTLRWRDNADHVEGLDDQDWAARISVLLRH